MTLSKGKFTILTILLLLILFATLINVVQDVRAQAAPAQGFWFFKRPPMPQSMKDAARTGSEVYLDRLTKLVTVPAGNTSMTNCIGEVVLWDDAMIASISAEIIRVQGTLDNLPE